MSKILIMTNHSYMLYRFRLELIQEMRKAHEVVLSMPFVGHEEDFQALGIRCIQTEVDRRGMNPKTDFRLFLPYRELLKAERPDMVITYSIKPNVYGGLACRMAGVPYCANVQGLGTAFQKKGLARLVTVLYKLALGKAHTVFFENEANAAEFRSRKIVPAKDTYAKFGPLIDKYTLQDAIDDKVTVPIVYEGRVIPQEVTSQQINEHLKHITVGLTEDARKDLEVKYSRFVTLAQTEQRLNMIAFDLHEHFVHYVRPKGFKAMLTCSSRAEAVQLFYKLRGLGGITPAVVITPNSAKEGDDETNTPQSLKTIAEFFRKEVDPLFKNNYDAYEDSVTGRFTDPDGDVDLLIVKDKLLTGFDAPIAAVLYVDKKLQDHTLLQAIARVNRVYTDKDFGLVVDYIGIFKKLNSALDLYSDEQSGMNLFDRTEIQSAIATINDEKTKLEALYQELWDIFDGIDRNETSANVWQERLREYDLRRDFYEKLSAFAKMVDFLYSSYELFEQVGFERAEMYRKD